MKKRSKRSKSSEVTNPFLEGQVNFYNLCSLARPEVLFQFERGDWLLDVISKDLAEVALSMGVTSEEIEILSGDSIHPQSKKMTDLVAKFETRSKRVMRVLYLAVLVRIARKLPAENFYRILLTHLISSMTDESFFPTFERWRLSLRQSNLGRNKRRQRKSLKPLVAAMLREDPQLSLKDCRKQMRLQAQADQGGFAHGSDVISAARRSNPDLESIEIEEVTSNEVLYRVGKYVGKVGNARLRNLISESRN